MRGFGKPSHRWFRLLKGTIGRERIRFSRKPLSQCQVRAAAAAARPSTFCMHARPAQRARASASSHSLARLPTVLLSLRAKSPHPPQSVGLAKLLAGLCCLLLNTNHASRTTCARADRLHDHAGNCPSRDIPSRSSPRRWGTARASAGVCTLSWTWRRWRRARRRRAR